MATSKLRHTVSLREALGSVGIESWAPVRGQPLDAWLDGARAAVGAEAGAWGLDSVECAVAVALPYDPRPLSPPAEPGRFGSVAAFASEHRYATLSRVLRAAAARLAADRGLPRSAARVAVNSRLPEKPLAVAAGLGFAGRSSLVVTRDYGPACVLGALLLSFDPGDGQDRSALIPEAFTPGALCGDCRACVDACPTGAIAVPGAGRPGLDLQLCIQYWAGGQGVDPEESPDTVRNAWGSRVYGCDICVRACPLSAGATLPGADGLSPADRARALSAVDERRPGAWLDLGHLERLDDPGIRFFFRGTALGFSWLGPGHIRANIGLAARMFDSGRRRY